MSCKSNNKRQEVEGVVIKGAFNTRAGNIAASIIDCLIIATIGPITALLIYGQIHEWYVYGFELDRWVVGSVCLMLFFLIGVVIVAISLPAHILAAKVMGDPHREMYRLEKDPDDSDPEAYLLTEIKGRRT